MGRRRSTSAPSLGWMGLVAARGEPASSAVPLTSTPGTFWTTYCGIMGLTELNGTKRWPCWPALCPQAKRGLSHRPNQSPERSRCPRGPVLRRRKGHRNWQRTVERAGLRQRLLRGARGQVRQAVEPRDRPLCLLDRDRRRAPQMVTGGGRGRLTSRPHRARVVPLRPVTRDRRETLVRRRSHEGTQPPTPGRRCPGTSRARCGGTAY